jgi:Holliday junction resolvase
MVRGKNKFYQRGYEKERRIVVKARKKGCLAFRSAGSHSPVDVFVLDPKTRVIELIQSKSASESKKKLSKIEMELKAYQGVYNVISRVVTSSAECEY